MPQLNPSPWFFVLLSSWLIFLIFSPLKLQNHLFPNDPTLEINKTQNQFWTWPWP